MTSVSFIKNEAKNLFLSTNPTAKEQLFVHAHNHSHLPGNGTSTLSCQNDAPTLPYIPICFTGTIFDVFEEKKK